MFWKPKSTTEAPAGIGSAVDIAWRTLDANRQWIAQADSKASTGLGLTGVGITVVLALVTNQGVGGFWQILTLSALGLSGIAVFAFALLALRATLSLEEESTGSSPIFFGGVAATFPTAAKVESLATEYRRLGSDDDALLEALTDQVRVTSLIAKKKFVNVNREMVAMAAALTCASLFALSVALS